MHKKHVRECRTQRRKDRQALKQLTTADVSTLDEKDVPFTKTFQPITAKAHMDFTNIMLKPDRQNPINIIARDRDGRSKTFTVYGENPNQVRNAIKAGLNLLAQAPAPTPLAIPEPEPAMKPDKAKHKRRREQKHVNPLNVAS